MNKTEVSMPTNIALIKYMGKTSSEKNLPCNASLSYTLNHLRTTVTLTQIDATQDEWDSELNWDHDEKQRFIKHLTFLKNHFNCHHHFRIHSENNFPAGCGLASSASSFAALTACAIKAFGRECGPQEMATLSRLGSGSSCRSFFSPWALWRDENVETPNLSYQNLIHQVIVVSRMKKTISSSRAHQLVTSSLLFTGRTERAEMRLTSLLQSFHNKDWEQSFKLCWQEFWDMHALFETCNEPFGYLLPTSIEVLQHIKDHWKIHHDGPLVTMDAGPNIHLLFRAEQETSAQQMKEFFAEKYLVL